MAAVVLLLLLVLIHIERLLDSSSVIGARSPLSVASLAWSLSSNW